MTSRCQPNNYAIFNYTIHWNNNANDICFGKHNSECHLAGKTPCPPLPVGIGFFTTFEVGKEFIGAGEQVIWMVGRGFMLF